MLVGATYAQLPSMSTDSLDTVSPPVGDVMTAAGGLTSAQIKYIQPIGNDTVTFTEIV